MSSRTGRRDTFTKLASRAAALIGRHVGQSPVGVLPPDRRRRRGSAGGAELPQLTKAPFQDTDDNSGSVPALPGADEAARNTAQAEWKVVVTTFCAISQEAARDAWLGLT